MFQSHFEEIKLKHSLLHQQLHTHYVTMPYNIFLETCTSVCFILYGVGQQVICKIEYKMRKKCVFVISTQIWLYVFFHACFYSKSLKENFFDTKNWNVCRYFDIRNYFLLNNKKYHQCQLSMFCCYAKEDFITFR